MVGDIWSADREYARSKALGFYPPLQAAELRLAGMSLASITNVPNAPGQVGSDVSSAVGMLAHYLESGSSHDAASSTQDAASNDYSTYLHQARAWHSVMDNEPACPARPPHHSSSSSSPELLASSAPGRTSGESVNGSVRRVLRTVPKVFFDEEFDVQDPATFHTACPVGAAGEGKCITMLEGHLDTVDNALEKEVTARATDLLDVSAQVCSLCKGMQEVHSNAEKLRETIDMQAGEATWEHACVTKLKRRKGNLVAMQEMLSQVLEIKQALRSLDSLLEVSDFLSAADTLVHTHALQERYRSAARMECLAVAPVQLSAARCRLQDSLQQALREAAEFKGMDEVTLGCCRELQQATSLEDFSFQGDLTGHFTSTSLGLGLPPEPTQDGALPAIWELQQTALWPPIMAAQRTECVTTSMSVYTEAAVAATKAALTSHVSACVHALLKGDCAGRPAVAPPTSAPIDDLLQWLRPAAFLALLQSLALLLRVLRWFYGGCGVLMDAALVAVQASEAERDACRKANRLTLQQVIDTFQRRWARLLEVMYAPGLEAYAAGEGEAAPVTLAKFLAVTEMSREVEKVCMEDGKPATAVSSVLRTLGKNLLKGNASGLQSQLEMVLSVEQWSPAAADPSIQLFLDRLFHDDSDSPKASPPCAANGNSVSPNDGHGPSNGSPLGDTAAAPHTEDAAGAVLQQRSGSGSLRSALESAVSSQQAAMKLQDRSGGDRAAAEAASLVPTECTVRIGSARFILVGSAGLLMQHIEAMLAFGHASLALRYEMGTRVAEILRTFNVRSNELLLGAGAIASAGLRSITARHMALCSQCLLLLEVVLAPVRFMARQGLPPAQVASLSTIFESVSEGIVQHRQKIHDKLLHIMRERLSNSIKAQHATSTSWAQYTGSQLNSHANGESGCLDDRATTQAGGGTARKPRAIAKMISQLAKQVLALHEAISPVMSQAQLLDVGVRIRRMYSESVVRALRGLQPTGERWLEAAEHDVCFLVKALQQLPGVSDEHGLEAILEYLEQIREHISVIQQENMTQKASDALAEEDSLARAVSEELPTQHTPELDQSEADPLG